METTKLRWGDSHGEGDACGVNGTRKVGVKHLKLVMPLLLALALFPISAFAEGGAATAEGGKQKEDFVEDPLVIDLSKKGPHGKALSNSRSAPSGDPRIVGPLGEKRSGGGMSRYERFKKDEEEKGPWHKRYLKSLDVPLEPKYILELPPPDFVRLEKLEKDQFSDIFAIGVNFENPKLTWKYLGEKDVDGKPKHVWVTALYAEGAKTISFETENLNICIKCAIYVYSGVTKEGRPYRTKIRKRKRNRFAITPGDISYIEYHTEKYEQSPDITPPFTFSGYSYGFSIKSDYESSSSQKPLMSVM